MTIGQNAPCDLDLTFVDIDPEQEEFHRSSLAYRPVRPETSSPGMPAPSCDPIPEAGRRLSSTCSPPLDPYRGTCSPPSSTASHVRGSQTAALSTSITPPTRAKSSSSQGPNAPCAAFLSTCTVRATQLPPSTDWHEEASFDRNLLFRCTKNPSTATARSTPIAFPEPIWTALCDCAKVEVIEQCS